MQGNNTKQKKTAGNGNNRKITIEKWCYCLKIKSMFNTLKEKMCKTRITKLQAKLTEAIDVRFTLKLMKTNFKALIQSAVHFYLP